MSDFAIPNIEVRYSPQSKDDQKPYVASIEGEHPEDCEHYAIGATPSEALLLAAAHWHARSSWKS